MAKKFDYGRMTKRASSIMERFAQGKIELHRQPPMLKNEAQPWDIPLRIGAPTRFTLSATVTGAEKFANGDTILDTDKVVTAAVFEDEPKPGDVLTIDDVPQTLIQVKRIPEAGTVICWKFIIKG